MYKELGLDVKGQKYRFIDSEAELSHDPNYIPLETEGDETGVKLDTLKENLNNNLGLNEKEQAVLKKKLTKLNKAKITDVKQTQNDLTRRDLYKKENQQAYDKLSKDIGKYQEEVNTQRDADVVDFTENQLRGRTNFSTAKGLINNNKKQNDFEKQINNLLVTNKYDTDSRILEEENNKLLEQVNPEVIQKRYEELKRMRSLLYQQEIKNMHKNKIKSKLYHKIKKKQRVKQEAELLKQLQEVDPDSVHNFLEKQKDKRIDERISLKHTVNKFSKTVKRYNLIYDDNVKESLMENYRKRDKLMEKIKNPDIVDDSEAEADEADEEEEDDDSHSEDNEEGSQVDNDSNQEEVDHTKILIDFNDKEKKKITKEITDSGVYTMNFMKKGDDINDQVTKLLRSGSNLLNDDAPKASTSTLSKLLNKKRQNIKSSMPDDSSNERKAKNSINDKDGENKVSELNSKSKITTEFMDSLKTEAEKKEYKNKLTLNESDLEKLVQEENLKDQEDFLKSFVVKNDDVSSIIYFYRTRMNS